MSKASVAPAARFAHGRIGHHGDVDDAALDHVDVSAAVHGELAGRDVPVLQPPVLWPAAVEHRAVIALLGRLLTADVDQVLLSNLEVEPGDAPTGAASGGYVAVTVAYGITAPAEMEQLARDAGFYAYSSERDAQALTVWLPAAPLG